MWWWRMDGWYQSICWFQSYKTEELTSFQWKWMNGKNYYNCWWFWFLGITWCRTQTPLIHILTRKVWKCNWFLFYSNLCIIIRGEEFRFIPFLSGWCIHLLPPTYISFSSETVYIESKCQVRQSKRFWWDENAKKNSVAEISIILSNVVCQFNDFDNYDSSSNCNDSLNWILILSVYGLVFTQVRMVVNGILWIRALWIQFFYFIYIFNFS